MNKLVLALLLAGGFNLAIWMTIFDKMSQQSFTDNINMFVTFACWLFAIVFYEDNKE